MIYVIGAIIGILFGVLTGLLKNLFLWKKYVNKKPRAGVSDSAASVYGRLFISNGINVIAILICFLMRNIVPFSWIALICGTAVSLSIANIALSAGFRKNVM